MWKDDVIQRVYYVGLGAAQLSGGGGGSGGGGMHCEGITEWMPEPPGSIYRLQCHSLFIVEMNDFW